MAKTICYISVNEIWSGSEVLWSQSARQMLAAGSPIYIFTTYSHRETDSLVLAGAKRFQPPGKTTLLKRTLNYAYRRLTGNTNTNDAFSSWLIASKPDLVVISQGNNVSGREMMNKCFECKIPYLTITQLVTEFSWLFINDQVIKHLNVLYRNALGNYFVSKNNLHLNNLMLSEPLQNSEVVFNPYNAVLHYKNAYPQTLKYQVAIVGRLECMHKGLDLLLQVLCEENWRTRDIFFTFYGSGPHDEWISDFISRHQLQNVAIAGHVDNIAQIWQTNHILLMPSRMEGQSLALVEAMYCQRCAIVTNVGGAAEIIENGVTGFIAANPSVKDLNEAMEKAWEFREDWKNMGEAAGLAIRNKYPADPVKFFNEKLLSHLQS